MRNSHSWPSAGAPTRRGGSGVGGAGDGAGVQRPMSTSGSRSEASTPLSGGVGTDGATKGGVVVVVRAGGHDRRLLRALRGAVVDEGRGVRFCGPGATRLVGLALHPSLENRQPTFGKRLQQIANDSFHVSDDKKHGAFLK